MPRNLNIVQCRTYPAISDDTRSTKSVYLGILYRFCKYTRYDPYKLVKLSAKRVQELIMDFVDRLGEMDYSKAYLNSIIRRLQFLLQGE
jgi:hypothetical protein